MKLSDLSFSLLLTGNLNSTRMLKFAQNRELARIAFESLIRDPFDRKNKYQLEQLKKYANNFEELQNQMYLYQGLAVGLTAIPCYVGSMIFSHLLYLPIPQFVNQLLAFSCLVGAEGFVLDRFRLTDFYEELQTMKKLYNWCLKDNQTTYPPSLDNAEKLALTEIQSFIKLLYPVCSPEFMLAWEVKSNSSTLWGASKQAIQKTISMFSPSTSSSQEENITSDTEFKEILAKIEQKKSGAKTVWEGLQQSLNYFTGPDSKIRSALTKPINASASIINYFMTSSSPN